MWKTDFFKIISHKLDNNWIALYGTIPSMNFRGVVVNIYNPCCRTTRRQVWTTLSSFWACSQVPFLIIGDFNEVLGPNDRGNCSFSPGGVVDFQNFIQQTHLLEVPASDGWFTWFSGYAKSKLDRLLVNPEWLSKFPKLQVSILKRNLSDHCPLLVKSDDANWGAKPFRFQNCWLSHPDCMRIVNEVWSSHSIECFAEKLKKTKQRLKVWNASEFGNIDRRIDDLEEKIHDLDLISNNRSLRMEEITERRMFQSELWECIWAQKSRARWIKEGDKNTKFFHTLATIRRKRNCITALPSNNGVITDPAGIHMEAVSFFKGIFKEDFPVRPEFNGLQFQVLSSMQADSLIEPFSSREIDEAVDSCNPQKAPRPDGFNFRFIKDAWEVIKFDVYGIINDFWALGQLPKGSNVAFIALIAKCQAPGGVKRFQAH